MAFHPIAHIEKEEEPVNSGIEGWIQNYKEVFLEHPHDTSQLTLILPDDCLVVAGPTRLRHTGYKAKTDYTGTSSLGTDIASSAENLPDFHIIGFANNVTHTETRQVQPLKALGSRRHIFSATNTPVQIQMTRFMILGINTLRSLYGSALFGKDIYDRNSQYANISGSDDASWFNNVEEDIFRVPIGIGIIYNSPATLAGSMQRIAGAEYFEACTLVSKNTSIQSGQTMVMEQVSLLADRAVPWRCGAGTALKRFGNDAHAQVQTVSEML